MLFFINCWSLYYIGFKRSSQSLRSKNCRFTEPQRHNHRTVIIIISIRSSGLCERYVQIPQKLTVYAKVYGLHFVVDTGFLLGRPTKTKHPLTGLVSAPYLYTTPTKYSDSSHPIEIVRKTVFETIFFFDLLKQQTNLHGRRYEKSS